MLEIHSCYLESVGDKNVQVNNKLIRICTNTVGKNVFDSQNTIQKLKFPSASDYSEKSKSKKYLRTRRKLIYSRTQTFMCEVRTPGTVNITNIFTAHIH
jgi:hypothetical protein